MTREETKAHRAERKKAFDAKKALVRKTVKKHGGKRPDWQIAAMIGVGENCIYRARSSMNIPQFSRFGDTEAKRAIVLEHYIGLGKPASAVALLLGVTAQQVRKISEGAGYRRDRSIWLKNSREAAARATVSRKKTLAAKREVKRKEHERVHPPIVQLTDSELIAQAVQAGKVTVIPSGHACGTTRWESALHTAYPTRALSSDAQRKRAGRVTEANARAKNYAIEARAAT